jgi:hypothetical protein
MINGIPAEVSYAYASVPTVGSRSTGQRQAGYAYASTGGQEQIRFRSP